MDHLECPPAHVWEARRQWFEDMSEEIGGNATYLVSEQACALTAEVQSVFCAGAWIAVIVLAMAVVDSALRETEVPGFAGSTKQVLDAAAANPALHRLRKRRNALMHTCPDIPAITVDQQWSDRQKLEEEAREAVRLMFEAFYIGPWV